MESNLHAIGISRSFLGQTIINNITWQLKAGEFCLLVGPNGAGKSTFLRLLSGLLRCDNGEVRCAEIPLLKMPPQARRAQLQYLGHESQLFSQLSAEESLRLRCQLNNVEVPAQALEAWGLEKQRRKRVSELSRGQTQKLALCCTLVNRSKFIALDEPTSSLDDSSVATLTQQLRQHTEQHTGVLIATHDVARLREVATRVVLLKEGTIVADSGTQQTTKEEVLHMYQACNR